MQNTRYMKRLFFLLMLAPVAVQAQDQPSYNESVLVKGSYKPVIEEKEKLNFPATLSDTTQQLDHTFQYSISPRRLHSVYEPARIKAARIIGEPTTRLYNNYIRLGVGLYPSTLADVYWHSTRDRHKTYGLRLNHRYSWGSIGDYHHVYFGNTSATLFGKYIFKDVLQIASDISYEHDHNYYYGFTDQTLATVFPTTSRDDISMSDYRAKYNKMVWNIGLRNMQLDTRALGYSLGVRLGDLWASYGQNQFNLNVSGDLHYGFNLKDEYKGIIYLHSEWDAYGYRFEPDGELPFGNDPTQPITDRHHKQNILKINPYADFLMSGLQFHAGVTVGWDGFSMGSSAKFRFFPDVVLSKKLLDDAMVLSVGFTGDITPNSLDIIRQENPYVAPGAEQRAESHRDILAHMRWKFSKKLELNAEMSYAMRRDHLSFAIDTLHYQLDNVYHPTYIDLNQFSVGADLAFVNDEMLTLRAAAHYYHYSLRDDNEVLLYHPDWDVSLGADVNYHDRWLFHLHGILQSKMDGDFGARIPVRVGINAEIEYRHNRALSFFAKVDNLAFQRYTYFVHYPSLRALCLLGITYTL